jgi:hypothetical protein
VVSAARIRVSDVLGEEAKKALTGLLVRDKQRGEFGNMDRGCQGPRFFDNNSVSDQFASSKSARL